MPWEVRGKCVYDKNGELVKCHQTPAAARRHQRALYANVEEKDWMARLKETAQMLHGLGGLLNTPGVGEKRAKRPFRRRVDYAIIHAGMRDVRDFIEARRQGKVYTKPENSVIFKEIGDRILWFGSATNNVQDRDREFVAKAAIERDVSESRDAGELRYAHLKFRLGGAPFFRAVLRGHLFEAGYIDDTPHAKTIARYIAHHPEGFDRSGWGMSAGFYGKAEGGVYNRIQIFERSVLPLSRAANQQTQFGVKTMPMTEQMKAALQELMVMLSADPEVLETAKAMLTTAEKSFELDEAGVTRKAKKKPMDEDMMDDEEEEDDEEKKEGPGDRKKPPARGRTIANRGGIRKKASDDLPDEVLAGIKQYIDFAIEKQASEPIVEAINEQLETIAETLKSLDERLAVLEDSEEAVKQYNEMPRTTLDRLKAMSATASDETITTEPVKGPAADPILAGLGLGG